MKKKKGGKSESGDYVREGCVRGKPVCQHL